MDAAQPSLTYFDAIVAAGRSLLDTVGASPMRAGQRREYYALVARIFSLLSKAHAAISRTASAIQRAGSREEAEHLFDKRLHQIGLASAMRATELCDQLEDAGRRMRPLIEARNDLDPRDRFLLLELTNGLERREAETAMLYERAFQDLYHFRWRHPRPPLSELKRRVARTAKELVLQKAEFDRLVWEAEKAAAQLH